MDNFDTSYAKLIRWFPDVPKGEAENLLIRQFEAGEPITIKDRGFQNLYIVLNGICNVINQLDNGTEIITLKLTTGDLIGVSESILGRFKNIATVKACTELTAVEMNNHMFQDWLKNYPSFTDFVLKNLVIRLHYTADFAANCQTSAAKVNLAKYLLDRVQLECTSHPADCEKTITVRETHEMIATFLGVSPRTVDRQILALKKDGLVSTARGKITISPSQYQKLLHLVTLNL